MNKKLISTLSLFTLFMIVGCTGNNSSTTQVSSNGALTSSSVDSSKITYTINIVDENGNPFNDEKTKVQVCKDTTCYMPMAIVDGKASIELEPNDYEVHLLNLPATYAYNPHINLMDETNPTTTVVVYNVDEISENTIVSEGIYNITMQEKGAEAVYYFAPQEAGTYTFETWAGDADTVLSYYGNNEVSGEPLEVISDGGNKANFKYVITVTDVNVSYNFKITVLSGVVLYPTTFPLVVSK